MKNKKNKKNSPNRLKCQISGATRMSNKTYIANKAEKFDVTSNVWASFYINKDEYKKLVSVVEEIGFGGAAEQYNISASQLGKWLRFNGRGKFIARVNDPIALAA
jgi:hypothetical protein